MTKANFGVVGMAVMGRNLALNVESRGYSVAIYNRSADKTEDVVASNPGKNLVPSYDVESFVQSIQTPRRIMHGHERFVRVGQCFANMLQSVSHRGLA